MINGAKTAKERADDAKKLLEWGFHNFEKRVLFAQGVTLGPQWQRFAPVKLASDDPQQWTWHKFV